MKFLVTGGSGFIGSHLVDKLLESKENTVVVIDDFTIGRFENLQKNKRLITFGTSILEDLDFPYDGIDVVFHLAALTRPRYSIDHPLEVNKVNVEGTLAVLQNCIKYKVPKVVFVSSAATYGKQDIFPISEDFVQKPVSPYALTKVIGEQYCKLFSDLYGLKINYIRPFNVYGKRQSTSGGYAAAIPNFIEAIRNGTKPYITGDGKQVRDFVYVDDVVDLMMSVASSDLSGQAFNAGSGISTSVKKIYDIICKIMKTDVKPDYIIPILEPETQADISKAELMLGWKPKVSLEEGLRRTIE